MKNYILIMFLSFVGTSVVAQVCVGEPGKITWEAWRLLFDDEFGELTAEEDYPLRPDVTLSLYKTQTQVNYDNYFGGRIRGFLSVPQSDSVSFNVTGNDKSTFYLSTDESPDNKVLLASHDDYTNYSEHTKFPEQTSDKVYLEVDNYYYFEIQYVESTGGDFTYLWWKAPFLNNTDWNIITASYLNDIDCLPTLCPDRGTACDDGDANTINDIEDGHCHCVGQKITTNTCIGVRGKVERYLYDNIPGSNLYDLYEDPNYPDMPVYSEVLNQVGKGDANSQSNNGNLLQGYLTVPVTGLYKFNITGDDNTILFISSDDLPENKQAHQALVTGYTSMTQHDKYLWQSTSNLLLEVGKYYYLEINQKQGGGASHFQVFWQTPYSGATWKRIPAFYFYDYECDIACIAAGTPCDDGNAFTNNDQYDANCDCTGIPCNGPDCDSPLANYVPFDKCGLTDQLDNRPDNNWLSCEVSPNPNPLRTDGHWIQYDMGERYQLLTSQVWNYNVDGDVEKGFEIVAIDYSEDGITWSSLGIYFWPLATGDGNYSGFVGPNFNGEYARYVVFTSLDSSGNCRGLGKVAFSAIKCPLEGTLCDDNNPSTVNDKYNASCECIGQNLLENECAEDNVILGDSTLYTEVYSAIEEVTSSSMIDQSSFVGFVAGESIILEVGFETQPNTNFIAIIDTCDQSSNNAPAGLMAKKETKRISYKRTDELTIIPVEGTDQQVISFYLDNPTNVLLEIYDSSNSLVHQIISHDYTNHGYFFKRLRTKKLLNSKYTVKLTTTEKTESKIMYVGVDPVSEKQE